MNLFSQVFVIVMESGLSHGTSVECTNVVWEFKSITIVSSIELLILEDLCLFVLKLPFY
jgi:hypothetical protein